MLRSFLQFILFLFCTLLIIVFFMFGRNFWDREMAAGKNLPQITLTQVNIAPPPNGNNADFPKDVKSVFREYIGTKISEQYGLKEYHSYDLYKAEGVTYILGFKSVADGWAYKRVADLYKLDNGEAIAIIKHNKGLGMYVTGLDWNYEERGGAYFIYIDERGYLYIPAPLGLGLRIVKSGKVVGTIPELNMDSIHVVTMFSDKDNTYVAIGERAEYPVGTNNPAAIVYKVNI